jgi:hypothetical protein
MVKDRIRELTGEAAGEQRVANGKKRHLTTWLTAVVHLWSPGIGEPVDHASCKGVEDREQDISA